MFAGKKNWPRKAELLVLCYRNTDIQLWFGVGVWSLWVRPSTSNQWQPEKLRGNQKWHESGTGGIRPAADTGPMSQEKTCNLKKIKSQYVITYDDPSFWTLIMRARTCDRCIGWMLLCLLLHDSPTRRRNWEMVIKVARISSREYHYSSGPTCKKWSGATATTNNCQHGNSRLRCLVETSADVVSSVSKLPRGTSTRAFFMICKTTTRSFLFRA